MMGSSAGLLDYMNVAVRTLSGRPVYLIIFVTDRCNASCPICCSYRRFVKMRDKILESEEFRRISRHLRGIFYLTVSGGEPFMRTDLDKIVGYFTKNSGVKTVTIPTNGYFTDRICMVSEKLAAEFPDTVFHINLSIDAVGESHDHMRGLPGCFDALINTYRCLKEISSEYPNLLVQTTTVLSSLNRTEIGRTVKWIRDNLSGVSAYTLALVRGQPRDPSVLKIETDEYIKNASEMKRYLIKTGKRVGYLSEKILHAVKATAWDIIGNTVYFGNYPYKCTAGKTMFVIDPYGNVLPCELLDISPGNVRDFSYSPLRILKSGEGKRIIANIRNKVFPECKKCTFECAVQNSILVNPSLYIRVLKYLYEQIPRIRRRYRIS